MSLLEQIYKCDAAGCDKREEWGNGVAERWLMIEVAGTAWGARRPRRIFHACSSPCERRLHAQLAGEPMTAEQAELEARAQRPDLAKRLDELAVAHAAELGRVRSESQRYLEQLNKLLAERSAPSAPVTHDELRGLLGGLSGQGPLAEISAERAAQDAQWGGPGHDDMHSEADWLGYIHDKLFAIPGRFRYRDGMRGCWPQRWDEDAQRVIGALGPPSPTVQAAYRRRLVQIAALALAALESFDRLRGAGPRS